MSEVALNNVVKSFGPVHVIKGIDLEVRRGEILAIAGGSGGPLRVLARLPGDK